MLRSRDRCWIGVGVGLRDRNPTNQQEKAYPSNMPSLLMLRIPFSVHCLFNSGIRPKPTGPHRSWYAATLVVTPFAPGNTKAAESHCGGTVDDYNHDMI